MFCDFHVGKKGRKHLREEGERQREWRREREKREEKERKGVVC